jgi:apolipoprotein N-acyltransferase
MIARLQHWKTWLLAREGKQRFAALFVMGALMALAFAPFHGWPLLFLTLPYLLLQLEGAAPRSAAWRSFFFGYGFSVAGTYWISFSMLVDVAQFGWMIPFCIFGIGAAFALYFWVMGYVFGKLATSHRLGNIFLLSLLWVGFEYLRSIGIFGFPWNLLGYVVTPSERLLQLASVIGTFGLSWMVMLLALAPVSHKRGYVAGMLAILIMAYGFGMWRVPATPVPVSETRLRIVQPNIPQDMKWTAEGKDESMRVHGVLTHMQTDAPPANIVIWSETAFPFTVYEGSGWFEHMRYFAPENGYFITGVIRTHRKKIWNSLVAVNSKGEEAAHYDKHQLVPFGEFVPLRDVLPLEKITPGAVDFSREQGVRTITLDGAPPFSPLVCYEVVFPWLAARKDQRPAWLLNVTNDAWYGDSPGPYQHFDMTRMRAIEQGLPLVRAANTGISALIDPYGRILGRLPLNERGVIDRALPKPLPPTLYARYGEWIVVTWLMLATVAYLRYRRGI